MYSVGSFCAESKGLSEEKLAILLLLLNKTLLVPTMHPIHISSQSVYPAHLRKKETGFRDCFHSSFLFLVISSSSTIS